MPICGVRLWPCGASLLVACEASGGRLEGATGCVCSGCPVSVQPKRGAIALTSRMQPQ